MNGNILSAWIWPALALAFSFGAALAYWWLQGRSRNTEAVNKEYFKGLNFLLNEEPDKAIEVFIKALEVDSETVELHLALGGLFRRKGQVDRATRIHQNLIARPSLTQEQRLQAIYELAQDYYKAGLLDRAENLFIELRESLSFRPAALRGLCRIYQQEKEWAKAIEVSRLRKRGDRLQTSKRIAHYYCEMAETAIATERFEDAKKYLRSALSEDRTAARAILLQGELSYQQQDYRKAIKLWQSLFASNPTLAALAVEKTILSYQKIGDRGGLRNYLQLTASIPREPTSFALWLQSFTELFGEDEAFEHIYAQIQRDGLSAPLAEYLYQNSDAGKITKAQQMRLLEDLLGRAKNRRIEYTCAGCGFDTKALHWLCPNCGEWDSFG